jgi:hypothetical protein
MTLAKKPGIICRSLRIVQELTRALAEIYLPAKGNIRKESSVGIHFREDLEARRCFGK